MIVLCFSLNIPHGPHAEHIVIKKLELVKYGVLNLSGLLRLGWGFSSGMLTNWHRLSYYLALVSREKRQVYTTDFGASVENDQNSKTVDNNLVGKRSSLPLDKVTW